MAIKLCDRNCPKRSVGCHINCESLRKQKEYNRGEVLALKADKQRLRDIEYLCKKYGK